VLDEFGGDSPSGRKNYKKRMLQDLTEGVTLHEAVVGQSILGRENFVLQIKQKFLQGGQDRERPSMKIIHRHTVKVEIFKVLEDRLSRPMKDIIASRGRDRQIAMDVLYRCCGFTNKEIGEMMGLDYSTVSVGRKRLTEKRKKDKMLNKLMDEIEQRVAKIKIGPSDAIPDIIADWPTPIFV